MEAIIPFKSEDAKSRLSSLLSKDERERLADEMLSDVVNTLRIYGIEVKIIKKIGLSDTINSAIKGKKGPLLIVMADLPLISVQEVNEILSYEEDVTIVPGRRGGTNVIFMKEPCKFKVDYNGFSFLKHVKIAKDRNLSLRVHYSFGLGTDVDLEDDLIEVLLHGDGNAAEYLRKIIFLDEKNICVRRYTLTG